MTATLQQFRADLERYLLNPRARPFVCDGSPLQCRSFIVGLNAATELTQPFDAYWSNVTGFVECAPAGGQIRRFELTPSVGLPENGSHDKTPIPQRCV